MNVRFRRQFFQAPADADTSAGGGGTDTVDRGDNLSPIEKAAAGLDDPKKDDKVDPVTDQKVDESEETEEERAEREAAEAKAAKEAKIRIPKSRFDEAQRRAADREQTLLAEIAKLQGAKNESVTRTQVQEMVAEIETLQDKYEDLILDGKKDEARKVRKQVDQMREDLMEYRTNVKSDSARRAAIDEMTFNAQLAGFEAKHPELNPEHEDFDTVKTDEVAELMTALVKSGKTRAQALAQAVKYVMVEPAKTSAGSSDGKDETAAAKLKAQRALEARQKAADANKAQPSSTAKAGIDSDKGGKQMENGIDIMKLDQKRFSKLDDEALAKLRGDDVTA